MGDMALYDLNRAFKAGLGLFYSASLGSLQVTVRKLLEKGFVQVSQAKGSRGRRVYRILPAGRDAFYAQMRGPIQQSRLEVTALARLYFLGLVPPGRDRDAVLAGIVAAVAEETERLEEQKIGLEEIRKRLPEEALEPFRYQAATLDYGIMAHRAALAFFRSLHDEEGAAGGDGAGGDPNR